MKRRKFIVGTTSLGLAGAAFGMLKFPRSARASGWGAWPRDKLDAIIPANLQAQNILELHINGGLNPFDTFYTVPSWGASDQTFVHQFGTGTVVGNPVEPTVSERFSACGFAPEAMWDSTGIADGRGVELYLGPWLVPLRNRPDITRRMRILVQYHEQVAHEGANPLSFTGDRLGLPRMAGIGTAIQRYFSENPDAGGGVRAAPYSYVLYPGAGFSTFNSLSASAVGFHPGAARPLAVTVDPSSTLHQLLSRPGIASPEDFDRAMTYYRQDYASRFRAYGQGQPIRSLERANYEFADLARRRAADLQGVLPPSLFQEISVPDPAVCNDTQRDYDMPRMQARLAASLLTRETDRARYVLWIDTGIHPHPNGGHDTHTLHTRIASQNIPHTMESLADIINNDDQGEADPNKISLDQTMVVINCEFGRTPYRQENGGGTGTNHWPQGYVNVLLGGPVRQAGCYGAIQYDAGNPSLNGYADPTLSMTPAENRMLLLQCLGIYPFSSQSFAVGDVRGGVRDEVEAAMRVRDLYLGLSV